jgi:phosphopantothenoylcysteine decarboxylase/phosphopantothenate--cysteine ligase
MKQQGQTIVLGVAGGIAAYKVIDLIQLLKAQSYNVIVIMTKHATQMMNQEVFAKASGNKVYFELFEKDFDYTAVLAKRSVDHIQIADSASLFVVIPATANSIAKLVNGIADDFLTTTALATTAPILFCPSMNGNMWNNPIVQNNVKKAKALGFQCIEPDDGLLACGYEGKGRLADIQRIYDDIILQVQKTTALQGKKVIVTAGGTIEPIDNVRSITSRSSGKMGVALAEACFRRGADVLLLKAKNAIQSRYLLKTKTFETADDLVALLEESVKDTAICFHNAAVSDFTLGEKRQGKIKSNAPLHLTLQPREKIIKQIKKWNPSVKLIGSKAECHLTREQFVMLAKEKVKEDNLTAVLANDVGKKGQGFEENMNEILLVTKEKQNFFPLQQKHVLAEQIIDYLLTENII